MSNTTFQTYSTGLLFPVATSLFLYGISKVLTDSSPQNATDRSILKSKDPMCCLTGLVGMGILAMYLNNRPAAQEAAFISTLSMGSVEVMCSGISFLKHLYYRVEPGETSKKLLAFGLTNIFIANHFFGHSIRH